MKFKQNIKTGIKQRKGGRKLLSEKIVLRVQKLYAQGISMRAVAGRAGITLGSAHKILSERHSNERRILAEIKKEESLKLYKFLQRKKHEICAELLSVSEITWLRVKGRKIIIESRVVIAERVNGVMTVSGAVEKMAATVQREVA